METQEGAEDRGSRALTAFVLDALDEGTFLRKERKGREDGRPRPTDGGHSRCARPTYIDGVASVASGTLENTEGEAEA